MKNAHRLTFETLAAERQGQKVSPEQRALAEAHLESCPRCRQEARLVARLRSEAAQGWSFNASPRSTTAQTIETVQERLGWKKRRDRALLPARLLAGLGAAAILVAGLAWALSTLVWHPVAEPLPSLPVSASTAPAPTLPALQPAKIRLSASDHQAYDFFGASVALSGRLLAVGAPGKDTLAEDAGGVYVYERQGNDWVETDQLLPAGLGSGDRFGLAVAADGETIAAGAPYATTQAGFAAGEVFIFIRQGDSWVQQARLAATDSGSFDLFGWSLALEGDTLVVGARAADDPHRGRNSGAAYVFHRENGAWVEQARLSAEGGQADDFFGHSVAILGEELAVGAPGQDGARQGQNSGAVYLFRRSGKNWFAQDRLFSDQPKAEARFGSSVGFAGASNGPAWLAVGANQYSPAEVDPMYTGIPGAIEVFTQQGNSWRSQAHFVPPIDDQRESMLGSSLAIGAISKDRSILAIGSNFSPKIYLYARRGGGWDQAGALQPEELHSMSGQALAISGTFLAVGTRWDSQPVIGGEMETYTEFSGAVYLYDLSGIK